jgi:hypothetical protein
VLAFFVAGFAFLLAAVFPVVFLAAAFPVVLAAVDELGDTNNLSWKGLVGAARPVPVNSRTHIVARGHTKPRTG